MYLQSDSPQNVDIMVKNLLLAATKESRRELHLLVESKAQSAILLRPLCGGKNILLTLVYPYHCNTIFRGIQHIRGKKFVNNIIINRI